jgi:hypothetical protein
MAGWRQTDQSPTLLHRLQHGKVNIPDPNLLEPPVVWWAVIGFVDYRVLNCRIDCVVVEPAVFSSSQRPHLRSILGYLAVYKATV